MENESTINRERTAAGEGAPPLSQETIEKQLHTVEELLRARRQEIEEFIAKFELDEEVSLTFEKIIIKTRQDARELLELEGTDGLIKIGKSWVLQTNEGGMGTGTSGPHLARQILAVGGIARLSSVGGGRYHEAKDTMQNNAEGVREIYNRLEKVFECFAENTGAKDLTVFYKLLNLPPPEKIEKMLEKENGKISEILHFRLMDVLTLAENILELQQIPEELGRGMLGINIMKKTEGYKRNIRTATIAFSRQNGEAKSNGLLTLSAGVPDDVFDILNELKKEIPGIQMPCVDTVVSLGASSKPMMEGAVRHGITVELLTNENPDGGGHLGAKAQMIKAYENERYGDEEIRMNRLLSNPASPAVIRSILIQQKEYGVTIPISFAGAYNNDHAEQKRLIGLVQTISAELEIPAPAVSFQFGTPFACAADGDATADFKFDQVASNYRGDNPAIIARREQNRVAFRKTLQDFVDVFGEKVEALDTIVQKAISERLKLAKAALAQLDSDADTIVFESTVKFDARAVPNKTLAEIITGLHMRQQECINCLITCSYAGRDEVKKAGKKMLKTSGDTPVYEIKIDGKQYRIAQEGFCIEEVLQKEDPSTGTLVFRGNGAVADEPMSSINVIANDIRQRKKNLAAV